MNEERTIDLRTGRKMPVMGLGTWELTNATAETVEFALDLGYRMIDTAADYGSQPGIGEALRSTKVDRDRIFLVAKVEEDEDAYEATERYLDEMDQDYADLMLIHRPPPGGAGQHLWEGLLRARENGLARDIGVSNYHQKQIDELVESTGEVPAVNQIEWSIFGWDQKMLEYCGEHGIVVQGYSPLTRGRRLWDERVTQFATAYDRTPAQILLRWALQKGVVPLPKANQKRHLVENLGAFEFRISDEDMAKLDQFNERYSALGRTLEYL